MIGRKFQPGDGPEQMPFWANKGSNSVRLEMASWWNKSGFDVLCSLRMITQQFEREWPFISRLDYSLAEEKKFDE